MKRIQAKAILVVRQSESTAERLRCRNCGLPLDTSSSFYSKHFCSVECKQEYIRDSLAYQPDDVE